MKYRSNEVAYCIVMGSLASQEVTVICAVHEKIDHNAGIIYFYLAPGMLSMMLSALTVKVWWL